MSPSPIHFFMLFISPLFIMSINSFLLREFSTGTQSSGVVAQRNVGGASLRMCFSNEYASCGTLSPQKFSMERGASSAHTAVTTA